MFKLFISFSMIYLSLIMFFTPHPLIMGLMILTQTMFMALLMGMYINTYWFSYILFLIFLGGLLVLFIYVSSMASNELTKFPMKLKFLLIFYLLINLLLILNYKNFIFSDYFYNNEMNKFNQSLMFLNEHKMNLSKLYDKQTFLLIMMLVLYLFITLLVVVKITNIFFGPLRSFN